MNVLTLLLALAVAVSRASAFAPGPAAAAGSRSGGTALAMVFGPKQALAMERTKNPQKFEQTITGLMSSKGLTRGQAEKRYGEFLNDPDGFALREAEKQMKEKGYKDWKERAIGESDDPEATAKRINDFQRFNSIKGTAIMVLGGAALLYYQSVNPYIPPGKM